MSGIASLSSIALIYTGAYAPRVPTVPPQMVSGVQPDRVRDESGPPDRMGFISYLVV